MSHRSTERRKARREKQKRRGETNNSPGLRDRGSPQIREEKSNARSGK